MNRVVTVKGKQYVIGEIKCWPGGEPFAHYWAVGLNGLPAGATRSAKASMKPGTVGRQIWDAVAK